MQILIERLNNLNNLIIYRNYLLLILASLLVILFIIRIIKQYRKSKSNMLSYEIKELKKEILKGKRIKKSINFFKQLYLYYPSPKSLIIIASITLFALYLFYFVPSLVSKSDRIFIGSNRFQNLITIEIGLASIIFLFIIFIIGLLGREIDAGVRRSEVLLKESYLFPIAVFITFALLAFSLPGRKFMSLVIITITAGFLIIAVYKLVRILLDDSKLFQKSIGVLKDKVKRSIDLAIDERLGNNILLSKVEAEGFPLSYYYFSLKNRADFFHLFKTKKCGVIQDINLKKLEQFAQIVENESRKQGYSFFGKEIALFSDSSQKEDENYEEVESIALNKDRGRYLIKRYKETINEDDDVIAISKISIKDEIILKDLENMINDIFIIKSEQKARRYSEILKDELSNLKDQVIQNIKEIRLGRLKKFQKVYFDLVKVFLETMEKFGGGYSLDQARIESLSIEGGWKEIGWIYDSVKDIFNKSMKSKDLDIILIMGYLPIGISIRAIYFFDHYIFNEFVKFSVALYRSALEVDIERKENKKLKDLMIDRSWQYLKDISDYHITFRLKPEFRIKA